MSTISTIPISVSAGPGVDTDAIHKSQGNEILAIPLKGSLVDPGDVWIMERGDDGSKFRLPFSDLPVEQGDIRNALNVGASGIGLFNAKNIDVLEFKNLTTDSPVLSLSENTTDKIVIVSLDKSQIDQVGIQVQDLDMDTHKIKNSSDPVEDQDLVTKVFLNTAIQDFLTDGSNLGTGVTVFKQKNANDLEFKTLRAASNRVVINDINPSYPDEVMIDTNIDTLVVTDDIVLTAADVLDKVIYIYAMANDIEIQLPPVGPGQKLTILVGDQSLDKVLSIKPNAADIIFFRKTATIPSRPIYAGSPEQGYFLDACSYQTGVGSWRWTVKGFYGDWTENYTYMFGGESAVGVFNTLNLAFDFNIWTTKTAPPENRSKFTSLTVDNVGLMMFGDLGSSVYSDTIYKYKNDVWSLAATMTDTLYDHTSFYMEHDSTAYICGGYKNGLKSNLVNSYDSLTGTYSARAILPATLMDACAESVGQIGWLFGGYAGVPTEYTTISKFDLFGNVWIAAGNLPVDAGNHGARVTKITDGTFFYTGGTLGSLTTTVANAYAYDIATGVFTAKTPVPYTVAHHQQVNVYNDCVYLMGGQTDSTIIDSVYKYNLNIDTWSVVTSLTNPISEGGSFSL